MARSTLPSSPSSADFRTDALLALLGGFGGAPERLLKLHPRREQLAAIGVDSSGSITRVLGAEMLSARTALSTWVGIPLQGPVSGRSALEYYLARRQLSAKALGGPKEGSP